MPQGCALGEILEILGWQDTLNVLLHLLNLCLHIKYAVAGIIVRLRESKF